MRARSRSFALGDRNRPDSAAASFVVDELELLGPHRLLKDRSEALFEGRLEDATFVRSHRTLNDRPPRLYEALIKTTSRKRVSASSVNITPEDSQIRPHHPAGRRSTGRSAAGWNPSCCAV